MALYDDKYWILSHIRTSFMTTDDTGTCELVMAGENEAKTILKTKYDNYGGSDDSDDDDDLPYESYDMQLDMDFNIRFRTNTATQLEKIERGRRKASKIKLIKWPTNKTPPTQTELDEMFPKKTEHKLNQKTGSLCSKILKECSHLPSNPYVPYAKFDGSGQINIHIKKYRIFITILPEEQRNYPLTISCIATAKIQDLIGLILLKCSTIYKDINWKSVTNYGLYITEDDGEVDSDFPCLDPRENISKFGFTTLGLVEHNEKTVSFEHTDIICNSKQFEDNLEKKSIRISSKIEQEKQINSDLKLIDRHNRAMEAPLYKSYRVYLMNKMRAKIEIHLGVSGDKIEIDPIQQFTKFSLIKQKPCTHNINQIAWCDVIGIKSNKSLFKIVYNNPDGTNLQLSTNFKYYEFEADHLIAKEIVQKINLILELRSSEVRKEYIAGQERKFLKKK